MFASTLTPSWNARSRFGLTTLTSFGIQALLVAVFLVAPLLRPPTIPLLSRISTPAAIEAVKQWRFRPYILNSEPVEVETQITVNFALNN